VSNKIGLSGQSGMVLIKDWEMCNPTMPMFIYYHCYRTIQLSVIAILLSLTLHIATLFMMAELSMNSVYSNLKIDATLINATIHESCEWGKYVHSRALV